MRHWLCITTLNNWQISKRLNALGFSKRFTSLASAVKKGDKGVVYVKRQTGEPRIKNSLIIAAFLVTSDVFKAESKIFDTPRNSADETYPLRFNIQIIAEFDEPIVLKNLVTDLSFAKKKRNWGIYLMGRAMVELSEEDYAKIVSAAECVGAAAP